MKEIQRKVSYIQVHDASPLQMTPMLSLGIKGEKPWLE